MPGLATEPLEDRIERFARITEARDRGDTLEVIGASFDPPLSKQRVAAILRAGPPRSQYGGRPRKVVEPSPD